MKSKILTLGLLVLAVLIVVSLMTNIRIFLQTKEAVSETEKEVVALENKASELEKRKEDLNSPAEIEKIARDRLGLGRAGEVIIKTPPDDELVRLVPEPTAYEDKSPIWSQWIEAVGL